MQDLLALTSCVAFVESCWTIVLQAALASHDQDLEHTARACGAETLRQRAWLDTKLSQLAPQALGGPGATAGAVGLAAGGPVNNLEPGPRKSPAGRRRHRRDRPGRGDTAERDGALHGVGDPGRSQPGVDGYVLSSGLSQTVGGARHLAHDQHRGLRGPTRTARLRDA